LFNFTNWLRNRPDGSGIFRLRNSQDGSGILQLQNRQEVAVCTQFLVSFFYAHKRPRPFLYIYPTKTPLLNR